MLNSRAYSLSKNKKMKSLLSVIIVTCVVGTSCLQLEEEPIMLLNPATEISAHIKNERIFATAEVNANPQVLTPGNIPVIFEYSGELAIYNTKTGTRIDVNAFTGGGLSQVYTVAADTASHDRFVVIVSGAIEAFADIGNDGDRSNDKMISNGDFYEEAQFIISELLPPSSLP